jgi:hypothetical protein
MNRLFETIVFSARGEPFTWDDAVLAAVVRGDWQTHQRVVLEGMACRAHAQVTGLALPSGEPGRSAQEFRYERNLLTAQQAEDWLRAHEVTSQEWSEYFRQTLSRELLAHDAERLATAFTVADEVLWRASIVWAICSGRLDQWARTLAGRVAVTLDDDSETATDAAVVPLPEPLRTETERAKRFAAMEARFQKRQESAVSEKAVRDIIASNRMDWIRVDTRSVTFADAGAANEAAMCVREDALDLGDVAADANAELVHEERDLDEMPDAARDVILGARSGDLVGPIAIGDRWTLFDIRAKRVPVYTDDHARARAERAVMARVVAQAVRDNIVWVS